MAQTKEWFNCQRDIKSNHQINWFVCFRHFSTTSSLAIFNWIVQMMVVKVCGENSLQNEIDCCVAVNREYFAISRLSEGGKKFSCNINVILLLECCHCEFSVVPANEWQWFTEFHRYFCPSAHQLRFQRSSDQHTRTEDKSERQIFHHKTIVHFEFTVMVKMHTKGKNTLCKIGTTTKLCADLYLQW